MSDAAQLLRMLEPAVRPAGVGAPSLSKSTPPIEQRSFDALLTEAKQADAAAGEDTAQRAGQGSAPLNDLVGVESIENDSLRALLARGSDVGESNAGR